MKIISPYNHPIIKQIQASQTIDDKIKQLSIVLLIEIISNTLKKKRLPQWIGNDDIIDINTFMECEKLNHLMSWADTGINPVFWARINYRLIAAKHGSHIGTLEWIDIAHLSGVNEVYDKLIKKEAA